LTYEFSCESDSPLRTQISCLVCTLRMKLISSLAVHGILIILALTSYCNFIVPAKSAAAYMHCINFLELLISRV
jgi:hypothetical protein